MMHRALSVILAVVLLLSAMPAAATAEESPEVDPIVGVWYAVYEHPEAANDPWTDTPVRQIQIYTFDVNGYVSMFVMNYKSYGLVQDSVRPFKAGQWQKRSDGVYDILQTAGPVNVNLKPAVMINGDLYLHTERLQYVRFHKMTPYVPSDTIDDSVMAGMMPQGE